MSTKRAARARIVTVSSDDRRLSYVGPVRERARQARVHPDAIAWRAWLDSDEGAKCRKGEAGGQYLENRLWIAFMAGRRPVERKKCKEREI